MVPDMSRFLALNIVNKIFKCKSFPMSQFRENFYGLLNKGLYMYYEKNYKVRITILSSQSRLIVIKVICRMKL